MTFPFTNWRLLITTPANGAWNMALDEAILESIGQNQSPPTLRLYAWEPPCLSLGYAQAIEDIDLDQVHSLGWDIVRRPTGGQAILHTDELTYSVIGPATEPRLEGSILESYCRLSLALLETLRLLGITAQALPATNTNQSSPSKSPICFEHPSNYEITVNGKKIIGSAQARRSSAVLQHGSLPLYGDLTRITKALKYANEAQRETTVRRVLERATTIEHAAGTRITWNQAAEAMIQAFTRTLNLNLIPGEISPSENRRAIELVSQKHTNAEWLYNRVRKDLTP